MDEKFRVLISEALEIELDEVTSDLVLDSEENWDSISLLSVIAEIDEHYGVELDGEELASCTKLSEVFSLIKKN